MITFEVEIKFRVENTVELERKLLQLGGTGFGEPIAEFDTFFQHPCRDFAQTDECLRLRNRVLPDGMSEHSLTFKGPKIDSNTKTRREIEISVVEPEHWESLLAVLGFHKCATVEKFRRRQQLTIDHRRIDLVHDTLPALPKPLRQFVEIEMMASEEEVDECRIQILDIAKQLGLSHSIRESYLKLVQNCGVP
jgi:adenylate cyclase class 2